MNKIGNMGNQVNFNGLLKKEKSEMDNWQDKINKEYSEELKAQGLDCLGRAKQVLVTPRSSDPKGNYIQNVIFNEKDRLEKTTHKVGAEEFEETTITDPKTGLVHYKNSDGTGHITWSGVVQSDEYTLVEYKDGKPITVVKSENTGKQTNLRYIKYEYPEGSLAAIKTETSVLRDYNNKGDSLKVPKQIQDEINS